MDDDKTSLSIVMTSALRPLVRRILTEDYGPIAEIARSFHPQLSVQRDETRMMPGLRQRGTLLIAYFSYTGDTRRIAEAFLERLRTSYDMDAVEIVPTRKRSYIHWLAYSFVPNSEVDIENAGTDLSRYDAILLGFPKWTFSCPPLNRFIRTLTNLNKPKFYLFMTSGGFDEQRFLDSLTHKLTKMGCNVAKSLTVKRKSVQRETYAQCVDSFVKCMREQLH
jgi:hypothetical protein